MNAPNLNGRIIKDIMALIPVYFKIDDEPSKALVMDDKVEFYLKMGAKRTPLEIKKQKENKVTKWVHEVEKNPAPKDEKYENKVDSLKFNSEIEKTAALKSVIEGDKGSGKPDTFKFHRLKIKECLSFEDIQDYTFKVVGKTIRKKRDGAIDQYQKNALKLIKAHLNAQNKEKDDDSYTSFL